MKAEQARIGQKVRIINAPNPLYDGQIHTIVGISPVVAILEAMGSWHWEYLEPDTTPLPLPG